MTIRQLRMTLTAGGLACIAAGLALFAVGTPGLTQDAGYRVRLPADFPNAATFTDTACLECHTNEQRLTELAVVPEDAEAEGLSSGPG